MSIRPLLVWMTAALTFPSAALPCVRTPKVASVSNLTPRTGTVTVTCPNAAPVDWSVTPGLTTTVTCPTPGGVQLSLSGQTRTVQMGDCVDVVWDGEKLVFQ